MYAFQFQKKKEIKMTHDQLIKRLQDIAERKKDSWFCAEMGNTYTLCQEIENILKEYLKDKPNDDT